MRHLVLFDAVTSDLPVQAETMARVSGPGAKEAAEAARTPYACAPPTAYAAYMRRDMKLGEPVTCHTVALLNISDELRVLAVPYHPEASWREFSGAQSTLLAPHMLVVSDDDWVRTNTGASMATRAVAAVPDCMKADKGAGARPKLKAGQVSGFPPLANGWTLAPNRFPAAPFWCLTMKHGRDRACYGRLSPTEPSDTVHSYYKPHWHVSLHPAGPRVLTVREKARIQGFPDSFVFTGTLAQQHKQIANAVSPQLGKAIGRTLLQALAASICAKGAPATAPLPQGPPSFSRTLQSFADFLAAFDATTLAAVPRQAVPAASAPTLSPATYEEVVMWYATQTRLDHSVRYAAKTPMEVLREVEAQHRWHVQELVGVRNTGGELQFGVLYRGWPHPEWSTWDCVKDAEWCLVKFFAAYRPAVEAVLTGKRRHFVLPGIDPQGPDRHSDAKAQLAADDEALKVMEKRYNADREAGLIHVSQYAKKMKKSAKKKAVEEEYDPEAMEEEAAAAELATEGESGGAGPASEGAGEEMEA